MRGSRRFGPFVAASAAIHLLALLLVANVDWRLPPPSPTVRVRVVPLDPTAPRAGQPRREPGAPPEATQRPEARGRAAETPAPTPAPRATPAPRPAPTPRAAPTPRPREDRGGIVVDLPSRLRPDERPQRPADSRFLSDRDRVVERETRARIRPGARGAPGEPGARDGAGEATTPPAAPSEPAPPAARGEPPRPPVGARPEEPRPPAEPPPSVARVEPPSPPPPARPAPPPAPEPPARRAPPVAAAPPTSPAPGEGRIARVEPARPAEPARPQAPRSEPSAGPTGPETPAPAAPAGQPRDALPVAPGTPTARGSRTTPRPDDGDADETPPARPLPGLDRLIPGAEQLARASRPEQARRGTGGGGEGGTGPTDYLPGVPEGDETFLNSREFRYAYYFNMVKRAIGDHWTPSLALQRTSVTSLPAEVMTELVIVVEKDGQVTATNVARASGIRPLDEEAVRAVRAAGQFPAPPAAMLDPDGRLRFPFGFVVTTSGGRLTFYGPDDQDLRDRFRDPFGRGRAPRAR